VSDPFRVAIVPGVMPGKWLRRWESRHAAAAVVVVPVEVAEQVAVLRDGRAHMAFVRLPVEREGLHLIPLYDEVTVVVAAKEHWVDGLDELSLADLEDEHLWPHPAPDLTTAEVIAAIAGGTGVVVVPMSVARLHHRRDVVAVPVADAPGSTVGLAWRRDLDDPRVEDFVGIVRGRTERSSREVSTGGGVSSGGGGSTRRDRGGATSRRAAGGPRGSRRRTGNRRGRGRGTR
jgi:uncharacterized membrane protein YgcG